MPWLSRSSGPGMASHQALMDWLGDGDKTCFPSPSRLVGEGPGRDQQAEVPRSPGVQPCPWTPRSQKMLEMETSPGSQESASGSSQQSPDPMTPVRDHSPGGITHIIRLPPEEYRPTEYKRDGTMECKRQTMTVLGWADEWTFIGGWGASPRTLSAALRAADEAHPEDAECSAATAKSDSPSPGWRAMATSPQQCTTSPPQYRPTDYKRYRPTDYKREGTMECYQQVLTTWGWSDVWTPAKSPEIPHGRTVRSLFDSDSEYPDGRDTKKVKRAPSQEKATSPGAQESSLPDNSSPGSSRCSSPGPLSRAAQRDSPCSVRRRLLSSDSEDADETSIKKAEQAPTQGDAADL